MKFLILLLFLPALSFAGVFKCVDANGKTTYNALPCKVSEKGEELNFSKEAANDNPVKPTHKDGGLVFELVGWSEAQSVLKRDKIKQLKAKKDAKFVLVKIKFKNERKDSVDIYCNFHMGRSLLDKKGNRFDAIRTLYDVDGNTGCNEYIQSGFSTKETIIFEIPYSSSPESVIFWDTREDLGNDIIDFKGEKSAVNIKL